MPIRTRPEDRRGFGRRDSSIQAAVSVGVRSSVPCVVRNYSHTGALIEFQLPAPAANTFRLIIANKGIDVLCQVRHRTPNSIGVSFVGGTIERFAEEEIRPTPLRAAESPDQLQAEQSVRLLEHKR